MIFYSTFLVIEVRKVRFSFVCNALSKEAWGTHNVICSIGQYSIPFYDAYASNFPFNMFLESWLRLLWLPSLWSLRYLHSNARKHTETPEGSLKVARVKTWRTESCRLSPETEAAVPPGIRPVCLTSPICTPALRPSSSTFPKTTWPRRRWTMQRPRSRCHGSSATKRTKHIRLRLKGTGSLNT